jgi:methionine sulfoxide reductase heme-binding subunit
MTDESLRRSILIGLTLGAIGLLVLDAALGRLGFGTGLVPDLPGTAAWSIARASGITAFVALSLDVVFGLFVSTRAADRVLPRASSTELHRWLSGVALSLTATHLLALLVDPFVGYDALDLLVPLASSYRPVAVGLGVLAAWGALVVHGSFALRKRLGPKAWRRLHFVSFAVWSMALLHGLFAGTDTGQPGVLALYAASGSTVAVLIAIRVRRRPRPQSCRPARSS